MYRLPIGQLTLCALIVAAASAHAQVTGSSPLYKLLEGYNQAGLNFQPAGFPITMLNNGVFTASGDTNIGLSGPLPDCYKFGLLPGEQCLDHSWATDVFLPIPLPTIGTPGNLTCRGAYVEYSTSPDSVGLMTLPGGGPSPVYTEYLQRLALTDYGPGPDTFAKFTNKYYVWQKAQLISDQLDLPAFSTANVGFDPDIIAVAWNYPSWIETSGPNGSEAIYFTVPQTVADSIVARNSLPANLASAATIFKTVPLNLAPNTLASVSIFKSYVDMNLGQGDIIDALAINSNGDIVFSLDRNSPSIMVGNVTLSLPGLPVPAGTINGADLILRKNNGTNPPTYDEFADAAFLGLDGADELRGTRINDPIVGPIARGTIVSGAGSSSGDGGGAGGGDGGGGDGGLRVGCTDLDPNNPPQPIVPLSEGNWDSGRTVRMKNTLPIDIHVDAPPFCDPVQSSLALFVFPRVAMGSSFWDMDAGSREVLLVQVPTFPGDVLASTGGALGGYSAPNPATQEYNLRIAVLPISISVTLQVAWWALVDTPNGPEFQVHASNALDLITY